MADGDVPHADEIDILVLPLCCPFVGFNLVSAGIALSYNVDRWKLQMCVSSKPQNTECFLLNISNSHYETNNRESKSI